MSRASRDAGQQDQHRQQVDGGGESRRHGLLLRVTDAVVDGGAGGDYWQRARASASVNVPAQNWALRTTRGASER